MLRLCWLVYTVKIKSAFHGNTDNMVLLFIQLIVFFYSELKNISLI